MSQTITKASVIGQGDHCSAPAVLDTFEDRLRRLWSRDGLQVADPDALARLVRIVIDEEGFGSAGRLLEVSGVRSWWNDCFARRRADFLAGWIGEHLRPPVLDVLGGDFTVLRALVAAGLPADQVVGCERAYAYETDWSTLNFPVHAVPEEPVLPQVTAATLLISTVLHHEPMPERLLRAALDTGADRWVVVENCIDEENDDDFHYFVDEFFNRCLNDFDVPCVTEHRTADQWRELLGRYGTVTYEETRRNVPGMPFPYTVFVVDR